MGKLLSLSHQALLTGQFAKLQLNLSDFSFAILYLYRNQHHFEIVETFDLFIKGTYDGFHFFMPTSDIRRHTDDELKSLLKEVDFLFPLPEEWALDLMKRGFQAIFQEKDSDYCYTLEKIKTFPGRKLSGRRNLVHQFSSHYQATSFPLTSAHQKEAILILNNWKKHLPQEHIDTDYDPCLEAIEKLSPLNLRGEIFFVDEKPAAFIIGEPLNHQVFVIHFAKADISYKGIYQYAYETFCKNLDPKFTLLNWESDLGNTGLRQSKRAYVPDQMIKKMRVFYP